MFLGILAGLAWSDDGAEDAQKEPTGVGFVYVTAQVLGEAHIFLDGAWAGQTGQAALTLEVSPGTHDLVLSKDRQGRLVTCRGRVEVGEGTTATVTSRPTDCAGLGAGSPAPAIEEVKSQPEGLARIEVRTDKNVWVQVGGGRPTMVGYAGFTLDVPPGGHVVRVAKGPFGASKTLCEPMVVLEAGGHQLIEVDGFVCDPR